MKYILQGIMDNLPTILGAVCTGLIALATYLGNQAKKKYEKHKEEERKEYIVEKTVNYVEQINNNKVKNDEPSWNSNEKKEQCKIKALEWLTVEGLSVADIELDILIESAVNKANKK